jgi:hypothetical protein
MVDTGGMMKIFISLIATSLMITAGVKVEAQIKPLVNAPNPSDLEQKARKIYEHLTGTKVPVDNPKIKQMAEMILNGNMAGAAQIATEDHNFYNITVKLMALEMSTREETIKTPLNDLVASFIGVARDQRDARELLNGNFYYMGSGTGIRSNLVTDILTSNNHYQDLEKNRVDLAANLVRVEGQKIATDAATTVDHPDAAGVLTSRAFMAAHAIMGTNRRLVEYTFREFMCVPLEKWADTGASDSRIGRDIDRFPAGDHNKFLTSCRGCHTVMDGFRGAFGKFDFTGSGVTHGAVNQKQADGGAFMIDANSNGIARKMNKNATIFPSGFVMVDDSYVNNAVRFANSSTFEWRGPASSGNGAKQFGTLISNSRRFSQCMALKAFKAVCRKNFDQVAQKETLKKWGDLFEANGYNLKSLLETIAIQTECL